MRDDSLNVLVYAQFMRDSTLLRDTADKNFGCYAILSRDELNCIVNYLATFISLFTMDGKSVKTPLISLCSVINSYTKYRKNTLVLGHS